MNKLNKELIIIEKESIGRKKRIIEILKHKIFNIFKKDRNFESRFTKKEVVKINRNFERRLKNEPKIYACDIETIYLKEEHIPVILGISNNFKYNSFELKINSENIKEEEKKLFSQFFNFIIKYGESRNILYFHNMGKFDGLFIARNLIRLEIPYTYIKNKGILMQIEFKSSNNKRFKFLDSYLFINYGLKKAGELFNIKYMKSNYERIDTKISNLEELKEYCNNMTEFNKYCMNDCFVLNELILNYNNYLIKLFNKPMYTNITISSYTYSLYLKKYYKYEIIHFNKTEDSFIRKAHFGGIVDIYKPYGKDLVCLDLISAYPSIMKSTLFPINKPIFLEVFGENIEYLLAKYPFSFIKTFVTASKLNKYPILPIRNKYRNKDKNMIMQVNGNFIGTFFSEEIQYALDNQIYEFFPISMYYYSQEPHNFDYIFKDYIEELFKLRKDEKSNKSLI